MLFNDFKMFWLLDFAWIFGNPAFLTQVSEQNFNSAVWKWPVHLYRDSEEFISICKINFSVIKVLKFYIGRQPWSNSLIQKKEKYKNFSLRVLSFVLFTSQPKAIISYSNKAKSLSGTTHSLCGVCTFTASCPARPMDTPLQGRCMPAEGCGRSAKSSLDLGGGLLLRRELRAENNQRALSKNWGRSRGDTAPSSGTWGTTEEPQRVWKAQKG